MCRFLLYKSKQPSGIDEIIGAFSGMAQLSKAYDGDRQRDGWGISWLIDNQWKTYKSVHPIWEEKDKFARFPKSTVFAIHARSASFPQHKNRIEYNQPYVNDLYSYVFNGLLKGVTLSISGDIGAQKIWTLVQKYLKDMNINESLCKAADTLKKNSSKVQAMNIGIAGTDAISAYSFYTEHPAYYSLHYVDSPSVKLICSEPIDGFNFKTLSNDSVIIL